MRRNSSMPSWPEVAPGLKCLSCGTTAMSSLFSAASAWSGDRAVTQGMSWISKRTVSALAIAAWSSTIRTLRTGGIASVSRIGCLDGLRRSLPLAQAEALDLLAQRGGQEAQRRRRAPLVPARFRERGLDQVAFVLVQHGLQVGRHHTFLVAMAGEMRDARMAGARVARTPTVHSSVTPAATIGHAILVAAAP